MSDKEAKDFEIVLGAFAAVENFMFQITGEVEYLLSADKADKLLQELKEVKRGGE